MNSEEIKIKAKQLLTEAKDLAQVFSNFGETYYVKLTEDLRQTLIKEIEENNENIMEKKEAKKEQNGRKKIWVGSYKHVLYSLEKEESTIFFEVNSKEELKDSINKYSQPRYLPVEEFESRVNKLKESILSGKLDDHLRLSAELLIHETIMNQPSE